MITYTLDEVRLLAQVFHSNINEPSLSDEELEIYKKTVNYPGTIENIITEQITPEATLMEFLGAYESIVNNEESREMLYNFLFNIPLLDMPLHINDEDSNSWKRKIAIWRIEINK